MKRILLWVLAVSPTGLFAQPVQCAAGNLILHGAYAVTITGTAGSPVWAPFTGPVATTGIFIFDGQGGLQLPAGTSTIVASNPPLNVAPPFVIAGSYTVNRDCTGNLTLNFAPAPNGHYNLITSPDGRQITLISTDKGDVLVGTASRQ